MLKLAKPEEVYAEVEGRLVELNVKNGEWVTKDTVLAKLSNPEKEKELLEKQQDHDVNWHKCLWFDRSPERENRAQAMQHEEFADKLEPIIEKITEQIGKLTLVANRDGQVVGAPHRRRRPVAQAGQAGIRASHKRKRSSARSATRISSRPT